MGTSTSSTVIDAAALPDAITIISVPAAHPYIRQITADPGVTVLPDPPVAGAAPGVWWPPAALDPGWIASHRADADLLHIHFGTESFAPGHLTACIAAAHEAGWPVVFTMHDLDHPQLRDSSAYLRQVAELVGGADAVTTLTPGAAAEVARRFGRDAVVIPHPSVLARDAVVAPTPESPAVRVGVHLKDLRPNVDGPATVRALAGALDLLHRDGLDVRAEVRLHPAVRDDDARAEVRRLAARSEQITLVEHERLTDDGLVGALSTIDIAVLPYRHGTHSGWLELCWDLALPVAAPQVGFYAEQHDDGSVATFTPGDAGSLASALRALMPAGSAPSDRTATIVRRRASRSQTDAVAAARHAELYRRLIAERRA